MLLHEYCRSQCCDNITKHTPQVTFKTLCGGQVHNLSTPSGQMTLENVKILRSR